MEATLIWRQINKFNQNLQLHNLIGLALLIGFGCLQYRYLRNCVLGPQKIDAEQLVKISDPSQIDRDYVTFTSRKAIDTGFQKVSKRRSSETTTNKYVLAVVNDEKALLVEAQPDDNLQQPTFTGTLSTIPTDVQTQIVDPLLKEAPTMQSRILPTILETGDYRFGAYFLFPFLAIGIGICSWNVYQARIRTRDPRKHPLYTSLARYGEADTIATQIDRELRTYHNIETLKSGDTYLTPAWLIHPQTYGSHVIQLERLMWVYKKVTSHSVNFIPTGKSYELLMHDNFGTEHTIKMSDRQLDETIEQINTQAPWAVVGFSDELKALWDKQRDDFYAVVEERKQESKK